MYYFGRKNYEEDFGYGSGNVDGSVSVWLRRYEEG
jgi:hypothetical protein